MTDSTIERHLKRALRSEDLDLVVACEDALTPIQRESTRLAAHARIRELLSERRRG